MCVVAVAIAKIGVVNMAKDRTQMRKKKANFYKIKTKETPSRIRSGPFSIRASFARTRTISARLRTTPWRNWPSEGLNSAQIDGKHTMPRWLAIVSAEE